MTNRNPTTKEERRALLRDRVFSAIKELDDLITTEYLELTGGTVVNKELRGGEFKPRKGVRCWHENDALRIMELRHRYRNGYWSGDSDRRIPIDQSNRVRLTKTLSSSYLIDLADFIAFQHGDPALVESLRVQASNALTGADVSEIYGPGISERYSVVDEDATHARGFAYFFFLEDGTLQSSLPPELRAALEGQDEQGLPVEEEGV